MNTKQLNYQGKNVTIIFTELKLANKIIIFGYSKGREINFHPAADMNLEASKFVLDNLDIDISEIIKPSTEHQKRVDIDVLSNESDGFITTQNKTLIMTPGDCVIFGAIDINTGLYGIGHSGRKGVGLNIAENFIQKLHAVQPNLLNLKVFIAPHIAGNEYPHENDSFVLNDDGTQNWWKAHPELYIKPESSKFYPSIGPAVKLQLIEAAKTFNDEIDIHMAEDSTFSGDYHSNSRDKNLTDGLKLRNLVFIGVKE
jgi:copper oxidase (laccase) domain-containing protein